MTPSPAPQPADGEREAWVDWLVKIGYGMDFATDDKPPCTLEELAAGWQRYEADPTETVDSYASDIEENTGMWSR